LVTQSLRKDEGANADASKNLRGLVLVNPATCFNPSALGAQGPGVASLPL